MIYLSWSIIQLVAVLVAMWIPYLLNLKLKVRTVTLKRYALEWLICSLFVLFLAFDVGTRQQDLQRSSFDATVPTQEIEKVERNSLDRNAVNENFKNTVKESN